MTWRPNTPRGDLLPVDERPRFQGCWDYIETEMQDDHFWDEDSNRDGHHKKVEMTNLTDAIGAGNVDANGDPNALSTSMNGMFYMRPKTATEAPESENQTTNPYYAQDVSGTNHFMQLGIRAMGNFSINSTTGAIIQNNGQDWNYQHNIATIVANSSQNFDITFSNNLPNDRYLVLITARRDSGNSSAVFRSKTNSGFKIVTSGASDEVNFVVIGG